MNLYIKLLLASIIIYSCQNDNFPEMVADIEKGVIQIYNFDNYGEVISQGTGFIINKKGDAVTNYHVVRDPSFAYVLDIDGNSYKITDIPYYNDRCDLAMVRFDHRNIPFKVLDLEYGYPKKGEEIFTIGHPENFTWSVSQGIVQNIHTEKTPTIQINAPSSYGGSGSPILNMEGKVIGIFSFKNLEAQVMNFGYATRCLRMLEETEETTLLDTNAITTYFPFKKAKYDGSLFLNSIHINDSTTTLYFKFINTDFRYEETSLYTDIKNTQNAFYIEDLDTKDRFYAKDVSGISKDKNNQYPNLGIGERTYFSIEFPSIKGSKRIRIHEGSKKDAWQWDEIQLSDSLKFHFDKKKITNKLKLQSMLEYASPASNLNTFTAYKDLNYDMEDFKEDELAHIIAGMIAYRTDHNEEAIEYFQKAKELNIENKNNQLMIDFIRNEIENR